MTSNLADQPSFQLPNPKAFSEKDSNLEGLSSKSIRGLVTVDHLQRIVGWNPVSSYITGHPREKVIGSSFLNFLSSDDEKKAFTKVFNSLINICEKKEVYHKSNLNILCGLGRIKHLELQWNRIILGDISAFNILIKEVNQEESTSNNAFDKDLELARKEKELAKLTSSNQQLEAFAYVASHDLKEPLRSIGNFTQLLGKRLEGKLDETDKEFFGFVTSGVKNMNSLIEDLLTYSRVNSGKHETLEIALADSLSVVLNGLHQRIIETDAEINIKDIPSHILGNPTKIKQLFQNLIANAIKFQNPELNPIITVSGIEKESEWVFTVSDNGIGIKEEYYQKIFGIFTKLHHKSVYPGSGIGLSVCQRIVEQHDGKIWVDSVFGKGTKIHFSIGKDQCIA